MIKYVIYNHYINSKHYILRVYIILVLEMSKAWNKDMDKCHGNTDTNVVGFYLLLDMSKEQNGDTENK